MNKKILLTTLIVAAMAVGGCSEEEVSEPRVPFVKTQRAGAIESAVESNYVGTVCGRYETNMSFQVGGRLIGRAVDAGSRVNVGDVLMTLDTKDIVQQVNQSEAQIDAALAQLRLAESDLNRYTQLYRSDAIPAAVLDQYRTSYESARASYDNAVAAAEQSRNALSYTNLTAEADGVISSVYVEAGQVIAAGQTVLTLIQTDELEVEINVPENRLAAVEIGTPVTISFWALSSETGGAVREISPMADAVSKTYRVRIALTEPPRGVQLGMTANATLTDRTAAGGAITLPISALYQSDGQPKVWTVEGDQTVRLKPVTVRRIDGNEVAVDGIKRGELVVTAGVHKLRVGQKVRTEGS